MKDFLRKHVGTTYAEATQRSDDNKMSVDMKDWGDRNRPRTHAPWQQLRDKAVTNRAYVLG